MAVRLPRNPSATVTMTVMPSPRYTTLAAPGVKAVRRTGRPTAAETSSALSRALGGGAPAAPLRWAHWAPGRTAPAPSPAAAAPPGSLVAVVGLPVAAAGSLV